MGGPKKRWSTSERLLLWDLGGGWPLDGRLDRLVSRQSPPERSLGGGPARAVHEARISFQICGGGCFGAPTVLSGAERPRP